MNLHDSVPFVKICGITNIEDGIAALKAGAALLGVVISDLSPRKGTMDLVLKLKEAGAVVATVHTDMESVLMNNGQQDYVQLHFDHTCEDISRVREKTGKKIISVIRTRDVIYGVDTGRDRIICGADLVLIDTGVPVAEIIKGKDLPEFHERIGLAGKISPDNVSSVMEVHPGFLDVSSSIESYPGKKSAERMNRLMEVVDRERQRVYTNS